MATYKFSSLPENMKVLIAQLTEGPRGFPRLPKYLPLVSVPVKDLPDHPVGVDLNDDRDEAYALEMDLTRTPPILIAHGHFLDGKHRVFAARKRSVDTLLALDLTEFIAEIKFDSLGVIKGF